MPSSHPHVHDVIIAGAGPVGLFLACELQLAGCSTLVLEAASEPTSWLKTAPFGLRGLTAPTVESLDRRGLLERLIAHAAKGDPPGAHWMRPGRRPLGHFAGIQFFEDQISPASWPYRDDIPAMRAIEMASLEGVLAERAAGLGVVIRRGCAVAGLQASDDGVRVQAGGETYGGRWLVGCDGARSVVRKAAGIGFSGTDPEFTGYSVQVELDHPEALAPGRHYTAGGMYTFAAPGVVAMADFDGGAFHRTEPITRAHVEAVLRRISGADVRIVALERAATWTDRAYQADRYRQGRVLLAGDAAHIHSPLGGQGLNLGLGDAMNLGWKLAATVRGTAPAGLIDSYAAERQPVAAQVLDWSRAQVTLMRPNRSSRALEAIIRDLIATGDGAAYFAGRTLGTSLRYDLGDSHDLVGRSAPDFELRDGTRSNEHLRSGRGLLLDFTADPALSALARGCGGRLDYLASDAAARWGVTAVLIRPDGIVAWARGADDGAESAAVALARWFGPAAG